MEVLLLNQTEVARLLPMKACIDVMEELFQMLSRGGAVFTPRTPTIIAEGSVLSSMPCYLPEMEKAAIKVTTVFCQNSGTPYHVHQGVILVFEAGHGSLQAILDAAEVTTIRTGAASALATRLLAIQGAGDLSILGAGTQGSCHLEAMLAVRAIRRVRVYDCCPERARKFAERESKKHGLAVETAGSVQHAVHGADLICIATPAREPVLKGEWVAPGTHINSVGFGGAAARELDTALLLKSRLYVDYLETVLHDCGDLLVPIRSGELDASSIQGSLGDLLTGKASGRVSEEEITLYKSVGVAAQDLAAASYICCRAVELGIGTRLALGGHNLLETGESCDE